MGNTLVCERDFDAGGIKGWRLSMTFCKKTGTKKGLDKQVLKRSAIKLFLLNQILSKKYIRTFS